MPDKRGTDNRGSTVVYCDQQYQYQMLWPSVEKWSK